MGNFGIRSLIFICLLHYFFIFPYSSYAQKEMTYQEYKLQMDAYTQRGAETKRDLFKCYQEMEELSQQIIAVDAQIAIVSGAVYELLGTNHHEVALFIKKLDGLQIDMIKFSHLSDQDLFEQEDQIYIFEQQVERLKVSKISLLPPSQQKLRSIQEALERLENRTLRKQIPGELELKFPWPPPIPTMSIEIPMEYLVTPDGDSDLGQIRERLKNVLMQANYERISHYTEGIPNGFVMISQLEKFYCEGTEKAGMPTPDRFATKLLTRPQITGLITFGRAIIWGNPGCLRTIAFIVTDTDEDFLSAPLNLEYSKADSLVTRGAPVLPDTVASEKVSATHYCLAYIYEYERISADHVMLKESGSSKISTKTHLEKAGLWKILSSEE